MKKHMRYNVHCVSVQSIEMKAMEIWNIYISKANPKDSKNIQVPTCNLIYSNPISSTNSIVCIRAVPKVSSNSQVSFQPFTENKDLPCCWRFMGPAAGYDWTAAGGKP